MRLENIQKIEKEQRERQRERQTDRQAETQIIIQIQLFFVKVKRTLTLNLKTNICLQPSHLSNKDRTVFLSTRSNCEMAPIYWLYLLNKTGSKPDKFYGLLIDYNQRIGLH